MPKNEVFINPKARELKHQKILPRAMVDMYRLYELWSIAKQLSGVEGCFLEVGACRGGSGALLARVAANASPSRQVFLADTFKGVVKTGPRDTDYVDGHHNETSVQIVEDLLASMALTNTTVLEGIFPEDTAAQVTSDKIALLHSDVDVYQSSKDVVEWALPRLSVGGVIIFDDYGFYSCEGVTRYVNELRAQEQDLLFVHNLNGHAVFIKMKDSKGPAETEAVGHSSKKQPRGLGGLFGNKK
jgi:O-methyltransferase